MVRGSRHGEDPSQKMSAKDSKQRGPPSKSFTVPATGSRLYGYGKHPAEEEEEEEEGEQDRTSVPVPLYFICPISLEIMRDPVTLCTGQTYDRDNIVKWFESGHRTCPVTGQPLRTLELIPNHMLRNLLEEWTVLNERIAASPKTATVDPEQVDDLLHQIKNAPLKHEAVKKLYFLASQSIKNQVLIIEQGAVSVLASILYSQAESEMEAVRAAKGRWSDKDNSSPDRLVQEDHSTSSWTGIASDLTSSTSSPWDAVQPLSSTSSAAAPNRQSEIAELVETSVLHIPSTPVSDVPSMKLSSGSPLRHGVEEEDDLDRMEHSFVGYLCFPLGRRKHAVRPDMQPSVWSSSSKNSFIRSIGKGTGHGQAIAPGTSVGKTMNRGQKEVSMHMHTSTARDSTSILDERESAGRTAVPAPAMSIDRVDAPRLSDGEKDAALACEEAMAVLNLFPLSPDDRQLIMAITNQGTAISWFLRSEAQINVKLNALRLMRNLLNMEELRPVVGSAKSIFIRLLRFVRHDLHPEGLKLVFEILFLLCASGAPSAQNAIEAGTIQALLHFLDSQAGSIGNSRVTRSPIIDCRIPLAQPDSPVVPATVVDSPTTSAHSLHYIDRTVALAIAQTLQDRAARTQPFSANQEIMLNKEIALLVLEKLMVYNADGLATSAMVKVGVPTLVWHMGKVSPHATEVCACLLVALCGAESSSTVTSDVLLARQAAIQAGAINQLVFIVQSGTLRTRQLAAQLLKVLHWKSNSASPSGS